MELLNLDVLREILSSTTDRELILFSNSSDIEFRENVSKILSDDEFWLKRLEFAIGNYITDETSNNWKKHYLNYVQASKSEKLVLGLVEMRDFTLIRLLSNKLEPLDFFNKEVEEISLKIITQIARFNSYPVLQYFIGIGYLDLNNPEVYQSLLAGYFHYFNEECVEFLIFSRLDEPNISTYSQYFSQFFVEGSIKLFEKAVEEPKLLFLFTAHAEDLNYLLNRLASPELFEYALDLQLHKPNFPYSLTPNISYIFLDDAIDNLKILVRRGLFHYDPLLLKNAIKSNAINCFLFLIPYQNDRRYLIEILSNLMGRIVINFLKRSFEAINPTKLELNELLVKAISKNYGPSIVLILDRMELDEDFPYQNLNITKEDIARVFLDNKSLNLKSLIEVIEFNDENFTEDFYNYLVNHPRMEKDVFDDLLVIVFEKNIVNALKAVTSSVHFSGFFRKGFFYLNDNFTLKLFSLQPEYLTVKNLIQYLKAKRITIVKFMLERLPEIEDKIEEIKKIANDYGYYDLVKLIEAKKVKR